MFKVVLLFLISLSFLGTGYAIAADQDQDRDRDRIQLDDPDMLQDRDRIRLNEGEQIYGWQLMSEQERNEYRKQMRTMATEEEREQLRIQHHKKMQERAKSMGKSLPDEPQQRMKKGSGYGSGNRGTQ